MGNRLGKLIWSAFFALIAMNIAQAVVINGTNETSQNQVMKVGYLRTSYTGGITAFAGGGQTNAVPLVSAFNIVTTVGTIADSVLLPPCVGGVAGGTAGLGNTDGLQVIATNASAISMTVYPQSGQSINGLSPNTGLAVAAGKSIQFTCGAPGAGWYGLLSA